MALSIRLSRGGAKKRPYYRIVVADSRKARDGRYLERLGSHNPLLPKDHADRVVLNEERIKYWLGEGAQPSTRVERFLDAAGMLKAKKRNNPNKAKPSKHTLELTEAKKEKVEAAKEAAKEAKESEKEAAKEAKKAAAEEAKAAAEAPAEEVKEEAAPAEAAPAEAAPAEAAKEDAPAEEAPAEEAKEEAPAEEAKEEAAPAEEAKEEAAPEAPAEEAKEEAAPAAEAEEEEKKAE